MKTAAVIQCHHVDWEGMTDVSLRCDAQGRRVIQNVIQKAKGLRDLCAEPVIACPDEPENQIFVDLAKAEGCRCYLGSSANVLDRLTRACHSVGGKRMAWLQGIHYFLDVPLMNRLLAWTDEHGFDYARCVDGTLKHVLGQVLTLDAVDRARGLIEQLPEGPKSFYSARPFAFMREHHHVFALGLFEELPDWDTDRLDEMRSTARHIYLEERAHHTERGRAAGDVSAGRYQVILDRINSGDRVLDIACGTGFGARILAEHGARVIGVDIDQQTIDLARECHGDVAEFRVGNAERIPLEDGSVDAVVSIGTVEHVPGDHVFVRELRRVLRPGGRLLGYTPQNRLGERPIWPWHVREYSLAQLRFLLEREFVVEHLFGWQNGVVTENDPRGDGTIMIARKKE